MFDKMLAGIRSKTREEWIRFLKEKSVGARVWVQEHPELSSAIAFLLGIMVILFQKFLFSLVFLTAVVVAVLLVIAPSGNVSVITSDADRSDKINGAPPGSSN